jgi:hypothetical protein
MKKKKETDKSGSRWACSSSQENQASVFISYPVLASKSHEDV